MRRHSRSNYVLGGVPTIYHSRSKFDLSYFHKTTGNIGDLLPLYVQEVYAGDTFKCDANVVARVTSSFLKPVMDNLFCDVMFFYVRSRTIFDKWDEIFGENKQSAWARPTQVSAPTYNSQTSNIDLQASDLACYLGLPVGGNSTDLIGDGGFNILPFRAYAKIYDEWYRDENLVDPMLIQTGARNPTTEALNHLDFSPSNYFGKPAKVAKMHDYFTQLLPAPQKGSSVDILPIQSFQNVPVNTVGVSHSDNGYFLQGRLSGGAPFALNSQVPLGMLVQAPSEGSHPVVAGTSDTSYGFSVGQGFTPTNLVAETSSLSVQPISVNDLRMAVQTQKMLERDAIYGTRSVERLRAVFGVSSSDAILQRSEFLGGRRFPLSVLQTVQTSQSVEKSPLGNVAGWSLSNGRAGYTKAFTDEGFVIGMVCVRQFHTYQQGVEKFWWRKDRLDYLNPLFCSIGYQPVRTREIYSAVNSPDAVFGYAPIYEDLRCRNNRISGQLASAEGEGLDIWHFADYYDNSPVLGQEWIEEPRKFVDRTLSVPSTTVDQFIFDVYFKQYAIRVLPTYGEPGLVDHH